MDCSVASKEANIQEDNGHHSSSTISEVGPQVKQQHHLPKSKHPTLTFQEVASLFQEPHIFTGYRPPERPWGYYLASLFWLHNETVNVWSHLLGVALVVAQTLMFGQEVDYLHEPRAWPVLGFSFGCCVVNLLSSMAHLLHSKSALHHVIFFLGDYAGITVFTFGSGMAGMYSCSHPHMYRLLENVFLPCGVLFSWLGFVLILRVKLQLSDHAHTIKRKRVILGVIVAKCFLFFLSLSGRYYDCLLDENCSLSSLNHITIVFALFAVNGLLYAMHCPEKWFPGKFDCLGHGHQWFHVSTLLTQVLEFNALREDIIRLQVARHAAPRLVSIMSALVVLLVLEGITVFGFKKAN